MLQDYLGEIYKIYKVGGTREESFYECIKKLLEDCATSQSKKFFITISPKKTGAGNPDIRVLTAAKKLVGYIEAKDISVENLDSVEDSEQLKRYRSTFPNLILTNFFEFRLYRNGEMTEKVVVGNSFEMYKLRSPAVALNADKFNSLLDKFFAFSVPRTVTAKALATELAKYTRFLRDEVVVEELREEKRNGTETLESYYKAFKEHLIPSLDQTHFADLFAQTITYGLFAARSRADEEFRRDIAFRYIPPTIGILKNVFRFISSSNLPRQMEWTIDDIAEILNATDVKKIIETFYKEGKGRDPIVHFYETFLAEYDPKEREKRGVYYTPEPVVGYIVRSIHKLLKEKFNKEDGFASSGVTVLDPASGTLTFPAEAVRQAVEEYKHKYGDGGIRSLLRDHILKDFYAFELMMAPYAIGHLKIGLLFDTYSYKLSDNERFKLFLTDTLDFTKEDENHLPGIFEQIIARESKEAMKVKEEVPVMVVMGNPPYSGESENKGVWILEKLNDYKKVNGEPLGERNPKWLQDDYVKFYRFAQWKIDKTGQGVLGFITNHAWLDNPTFRGMRCSLLSSFDEIYILNLHGSTLKRERTPEGGKDENVFDIRPGVAIVIFIKTGGSSDKKIWYSDIYGLREEKYRWLDARDVKNVDWHMLLPTYPTYYFIPTKEEGRKEYESFVKITDIFPVNSVGIVTARDELTIRFSADDAWKTVLNFSSYDPEYARAAFDLGKDARDWKVELAQRDLKESGPDKKFISPILYRPFDVRYTYYTGKTRGFHCMPRPEVMRHMLRSNLALTLTKKHQSDKTIDVFVGDKIIEGHLLSGELGITYTFPLYLYYDKEKQHTIFKGQSKLGLPGSQQPLSSKREREPNINPKILETLKNAFSVTPSPEEILHYIYAILYSNIYRGKYSEFLKVDFPRVPFTKNKKLFDELATLGAKLVELHFLHSEELDKPIVKFEGTGDGLISSRKYNTKTSRVYINDSQYFTDVSPEVWQYQIGGYQVLDKWLKDRKGRRISAEEIKIYCQIATALAKTIEIQKEIDELYSSVDGNY